MPSPPDFDLALRGYARAAGCRSLVRNVARRDALAGRAEPRAVALMQRGMNAALERLAGGVGGKFNANP
jgi:hypothetical protein